MIMVKYQVVLYMVEYLGHLHDGCFLVVKQQDCLRCIEAFHASLGP